MRGFPFGGCRALNDLFVHPAAARVRSRRDAETTTCGSIRPAAWGKWAGEVNYEQPLHQDGNHSCCRGAWSRVSGTWRRFSTCPTSTRTARRRGSCLASRTRLRLRGALRARSRRDGQARLVSRLPLRRVAPRHATSAGPTRRGSCSVISFRPAAPTGSATTRSADWATTTRGTRVVRDKTPDQLSLFGFPPSGCGLLDHGNGGRARGEVSRPRRHALARRPPALVPVLGRHALGAEFAAAHLAGVVAQRLVDEFERARHLVAHEPVARNARSASSSKVDGSACTMACTRLPRSSSGRPMTAQLSTDGMFLQRGLDLGRVDVGAAAQNHVADAIAEVEVAVGVDPAVVAQAISQPPTSCRASAPM